MIKERRKDMHLSIGQNLNLLTYTISWARLLFRSANHDNTHSTYICPSKELSELLHSQISTELYYTLHQPPPKHAHIKHTQTAHANSLGSDVVSLGLQRDSKSNTCQTKQEKECWTSAPPDHAWADRGGDPQCESAPQTPLHVKENEDLDGDLCCRVE